MKTITSKKAARLLPGLLPDDNKYTRGLCELVVGDPIYAGAGVLAVMAATRMGAGYVRAYTSFETAAALRVVQPSCVCQPVDTFVEHRHAACEGRPCAVVVGSGFAVSDAAKATVLDVLRLTQAPVLVDGGGLATLATDEGASALRERFVAGLPTVITPHRGEAERILATLNTEEVQASRARCEKKGIPAAAFDALLIARAFGVICVLKGPDTYIADGNEESADDVLVLTCGTPALAKAGTGDVLAGMIAALLAQGMDALEASVLGAELHARAGLAAAARWSAIAVCAEDVVECLPAALAELVGAEGTLR